MTEQTVDLVRPSAVAGMFYPAERQTLQRDVDALLDRASVSPVSKTTVIALIVPHAGYVYSGFTAAHAYRRIHGMSFDTVIAIAPSHREYFRGVSVYPGSAYRTPLGDVRIDEELRAEFMEHGVACAFSGHRAEHAVEVQLPFLQRSLGEFRLLPLIMGEQLQSVCESLAKTIAALLQGRRVLLLASSDLSHFHSYRDALSLDHRVIDLIQHYDPSGLMSRLEDETLEACGGGPIVTVMEAARALGATQAEILHYCNSGDITGEQNSVVGYVAAAMVRVN